MGYGASRAVLAVLLFLVLAAPARAAVLLDQEHYAYSDGSLTHLIGEGVPYVAQTVTPLGQGLLARVDVYVYTQASYGGDWTFSIRAVDGSGVPTGTILASQIVNSADVHPVDFDFVNPTVVNFTTPAAITAGTPFAICVSPNPPVYGAGQGKGYWNGTIATDPVHYAGGRVFSSLNGTSFVAGSAGHDLFFRTYVDGVITPEPSGMAALCLLALACRRRRRIRRREVAIGDAAPANVACPHP